MAASRDMAARSDTPAETGKRELVITRVFDAPRALVFKAWTEPERLVLWWGPQGFTIPFCEMDVRPGGAWRVCMRGPDGTDHWVRGVYREIVEPERLAFSWAWENADGNPREDTLVTLTFAEHGERTTLTLHHAGFATDTGRDEHHGGWASCLERLPDYLATA